MCIPELSSPVHAEICGQAFFGRVSAFLQCRMYLHTSPARRLLAEFPMKACSDCSFSEGGHLFAAASNNTIAVYNTFTCELVGTLRCALTPWLACVLSNVFSSLKIHAQ
jgi:hypothetical protein